MNIIFWRLVKSIRQRSSPYGISCARAQEPGVPCTKSVVISCAPFFLNNNKKKKIGVYKALFMLYYKKFYKNFGKSLNKIH